MFLSKLNKNKLYDIFILGIVISLTISMIYFTPIEWMSTSRFYWLWFYIYYLTCSGLLFLGIFSLTNIRENRKVIRELNKIDFDENAKESDKRNFWVNSKSFKAEKTK